MLGVPHASPATLAALFLGGAALLAVAWLALGRPWPRRLEERAVAVSLAAAMLALPYVLWRVVEDVRYTRGLDPYEARAAGPIQAFLPGYLVDGVRAIVPSDETYATVVGSSVPYSSARKAFPALALTTLFPRRSVPIREAQWIVAWGVSPASVAPVGRIMVARSRQGPLPAVLVARVRR